MRKKSSKPFEIIHYYTFPHDDKVIQLIASISTILATDRSISNLVKSTRIGRLATELAHDPNNHLLVDGKSPNGLAAASYLYFDAILLGVNLPLTSLAGITEFQTRSSVDN
jgi:transcription initiation factor TFIIB